jgi:hypothetical protein
MSTQDWTPGERREIDRALRNFWPGQMDAKMGEYRHALEGLGVGYERVLVALKALARRPPSIEQVVAEIRANNAAFAERFEKGEVEIPEVEVHEAAAP